MRLPTKNCYLPSTSARMRSLATAVTNLQHTLKGVQGEINHEALCALGKTGRTGLQIASYFQEILWAQFLASSLI